MTRKVEHLQIALESRAAIEQAKGMLMLHYGVSAERAFQLLARCSQDEHIKLHALSVAVVHSGLADASARQGDSQTRPSSASLVDRAIRRVRSQEAT